MKLPIRTSDEAEAELLEAARWYEGHRAGLGGEFISAVDAAVDRIKDNPGAGSRPSGVSDPDIGRVFVRRFPYHVVYIHLADRVQSLAIAHDRRRPRYWVGRLPA